MMFPSSLRQRKEDRLMRYRGPRQFQPYARRNGIRPRTVEPLEKLLSGSTPVTARPPAALLLSAQFQGHA
jgi:hypothetical protein